MRPKSHRILLHLGFGFAIIRKNRCIMSYYFDRLKSRSKELGKHYQKYILLLERDLDALVRRLEEKGLHESVHLWTPATDFHEEMTLISKLGETVRENRVYLGCFFALQLLHLNLSALDALQLEVMSSLERLSVYKTFMLRVGHDLRQLTRAYMQHILSLYLSKETFDSFVFLGVGTRSDQDDIDIGVVDDGSQKRDEINKAISRLNADMLKKAISLHFHLSEHVGSDTSYSASIDEYCALLDKEIHDFVIITEMLGAARIFGSLSLRKRFNREVVNRYYYNSKSTNTRFHEGYLRGIIGEARSFLLRVPAFDRLNPKDDGLRMIKTSLFAAKTISGLRQVNAWSMIHSLKRLDKTRRQNYEKLEASLTFLEIFRYLYQLLIVQEEDIFINEKGATANLKRVAGVMGYKRIGAETAEHFLLTDYYYYIDQAKNIIEELLPRAVRHLKSISVFGKLLRHKKATGAGQKRIGNLAVHFQQETQFFRGTRFWDDIISIFESKDAKLLKRLLNDFASLPPDKKKTVQEGFIEWSRYSFIATFRFAILLYKYRNTLTERDFFKYFNDDVLTRVRYETEQTQRISVVFLHYPDLIINYINTLSEGQRRKYRTWLDRNLWGRELLQAHDSMRTFLNISIVGSAHFQRRMLNVLSKNPDYVHHLNNPRRLRLIGRGSLAEAERAQVLTEKKENILDFFDFEFFRVGLQSLSGSPAQHVARQFTDFSDHFLRLAFDFIKQETDISIQEMVNTGDLFGVFVTGGQGQEQAFCDDYDLLILLNSDDKSILDYCTKMCGKANSFIAKSGIIPHYSLLEKFGSYVFTFGQLKQLMQQGQITFIEKSQLLCARMVVGSSILQEAFEQNILEPFVFHEPFSYVQAMRIEVDNRQKEAEKRTKIHDSVNIKEDPGGLRDIEMLLMMLRVVYPENREYSNYRFLLNLENNPGIHNNVVRRLRDDYEFLRKIRNITRLTVFSGDLLDPNTIKYQAEVYAPFAGKFFTPEKLYKKVKRNMSTARKAYNEINATVIQPWFDRRKVSV